MKTVCYFGSYDPNFSRNRLILSALKRNETRVINCRASGFLVSRYFHLLMSFLKDGKKADVIFVGVVGHYDVPLAWFLARVFGKRLIFDAFISLYDTYVFDRQIVYEGSFSAKRVFLIDKISCLLADKIILDTKTQIDFFSKTFSILKKKFVEIPVSADERIFYPRPLERNKKFIVGYYGSFQPLHGVDVIVNAAKNLEEKSDIEFRFLGDGQKFEEIKNLVKEMSLGNVGFYKRVPYEKLPLFIGELDVVLCGPFGKSDKAKRVVPFKIAESLAMAKPIIACDTSPIKDLLTDRFSAVICPRGEPSELAKKIKELKENMSLRNKIGQNGHKVFLQKLSLDQLGRKLGLVINE